MHTGARTTQASCATRSIPSWSPVNIKVVLVSTEFMKSAWIKIVSFRSRSREVRIVGARSSNCILPKRPRRADAYPEAVRADRFCAYSTFSEFGIQALLKTEILP